MAPPITEPARPALATFLARAVALVLPSIVLRAVAGPSHMPYLAYAFALVFVASECPFLGTLRDRRNRFPWLHRAFSQRLALLAVAQIAVVAVFAMIPSASPTAVPTEPLPAAEADAAPAPIELAEDGNPSKSRAEDGNQSKSRADDGNPSTSRAEDGNPSTSRAEDGNPSKSRAPIGADIHTMSVVLPCAGEEAFATRTAESVFDSLPADRLAEILIVDDANSPPLRGNHGMSEEFLAAHKARVIRLDDQVGLIQAKRIGGDLATGDLIVFFDCHVAPQVGWWEPFFALTSENYKRIVVPMITDLNLDDWTERVRNDGQAKCYLTFDSDFKWFTDNNIYAPALSGGLLGMPRRWWEETGGYDPEMAGWGGENLEQALRTWLCGGEIVVARSSYVAHMWRTPADPRTQVKYSIPHGSVNKNRMRAIAAWMGPFLEKATSDFPIAIGTEIGDLSAVKKYSDQLKCHSFGFYLHRFKHLYVAAGLMPAETFQLRHKSSGTCLQYSGIAGTSGNGVGTVFTTRCLPANHRQRFHMANQLKSVSNLRAGQSQPPTGRRATFWREHTLSVQSATRLGVPSATTEYETGCCSGLKAWNTDQCFEYSTPGELTLTTNVCDVNGSHGSQRWRFVADTPVPDGGIPHDSADLAEFSQVGVLTRDPTECLDEKLDLTTCGGAAGEWIKEGISRPMEWKMYEDELRSAPEFYEELGKVRYW